MRHYIISAVTHDYAKMKKVWHCKRQNLPSPYSRHEYNVYVCANSNAKEILFFCPKKILSRWIGQGWIQNLTITPDGIYYIDADWGDVGLLRYKEYQHVFTHLEPPHSSLLIHHVLKRFPSHYRLFDIKSYAE